MVNRTPCDAHNQVAGGTPTSSTDATTAVRRLIDQVRGIDILSCFAACRTIDALIGDTPRRRATSSDRSHRRLTVLGIPPDNVAIVFTADAANSSGGSSATINLFSMYASTSS